MYRFNFAHWLLFLPLIMVSWQVGAASRVLDHIEVNTAGDDNVIAVYFNVPVRYVSHVANDAKSEIGVQLQIVPDSELDLEQQAIQAEINLENLMTRDQLSWNPTQEMPLAKVVYQGTGLGTSSLLVSFAAPVKDYRIRQSRDFYVMEFVMKKRPKLPEVDIRKLPAIDIDVPETRPPLSFKSLPLMIYVINLSSEATPIDPAAIAPVPVEGTQALYTTKAEVNGRNWYRLRLGFFRTQNEAKAKLKAIKNFYPKAWIDRADVKERRQALFESGMLPESEMVGGALVPGMKVIKGMVGAAGVAGAAGAASAAELAAKRAAELARAKAEAEQAAEAEAEQIAEVEQPMSPADERLTKMIELIRHTMTAGEYGKAIRMLEGFLEEPENVYTKEARELLGLARERNGQFAHAKAEYEAFLEKYPDGEDAERVQQRLLGLITAPKTPHEPLQDEEEKVAVEWRTYGSLTERYRRDSVDKPGDENDIVSRSDIESFVNVNSRRRSQSLDINMRLTGSYTADLLSDGPGNDKTLSYAYVDVEHLDTRTNLRVGRQNLRSSGTLGRFDGVVLGYELTPTIHVRATTGLPVSSSGDVFLNKHKSFIGFSGDVSDLFENWDFSLFVINQNVDELVDRRAVGGEFRYFDKEKSLFGMLDYDINFGALNILSLQGNWTLADETRLYMNLGYRKSPLLHTSTAITSYYIPDLYGTDPLNRVFDRVDSIKELLKFENEDYIYDRAEALSANTTTLLLGASRPLTPSLQISGDLTITSVSGVPQLGTVTVDANGDVLDTSNDYRAAVDDTGNEYYFSVQLIKNDLLKQGDIGILNLRYYDTRNANTLRLGASSRYPITNVWRLNPRIDFSFRKRTDVDETRLTVSPYLRTDYRLRKDFSLEFESGMDWYKNENQLETTKSANYFFIGGFRWDF